LVRTRVSQRPHKWTREEGPFDRQTEVQCKSWKLSTTALDQTYNYMTRVTRCFDVTHTWLRLEVRPTFLQLSSGSFGEYCRAVGPSLVEKGLVPKKRLKACCDGD
jgi:hypothetical protein